MRVTIVGGTGNIGTALVRRLADHDVTVVARRRPDGDDAPHVRTETADIRADDLPSVAQAEAVVSLAWLFQPSHQPDVTWLNNVVGTARVLAAAAHGNARIVVVASSIAAYSPVPAHDIVDESHPTHGASSAAYCREKAYVERLLDVFEREHPDIRVVRVRPAFVFQRSSAAQQRRLFGGPLVPGSLLRPGLIPLVPFPSGLRMQAVHSDDVGDAIGRIVETDDATGAFNLAADDSLDGDDVAGLFAARRLPVPPRAARVALSAAWHARAVPAPPDLYDALLRLPTMATERAKSVLGWTPDVSAADALTDMLAGLRTGEGGSTPPLAADAGGTARWREVATGVGTTIESDDDPRGS